MEMLGSEHRFIGDNKQSGPCYTKLTIDGDFTMYDNYHGNRAQQPIKIKVSMVVTIDVAKLPSMVSFVQLGLWPIF